MPISNIQKHKFKKVGKVCFVSYCLGSVKVAGVFLNILKDCYHELPTLEYWG